MWLLYAEAFGAMFILILIVWWTMFHGRHKGERGTPAASPATRREEVAARVSGSQADAGGPRANGG